VIASHYANSVRRMQDACKNITRNW